MRKLLKLLFLLPAALSMASCGDDDNLSEEDLLALGEGDRISNEAMSMSRDNGFRDYQGVCNMLVFGPEDGYAEDTWHFVYQGMDFLWTPNGLHFLGYNFNDEYRPMASDEMYDDGSYYTPLFRAQTFTGESMTYETPDGRRTYKIYPGGTLSLLYAHLGSNLVLLPDDGGHENSLWFCDKDTYRKGTNTGSGSGSGSGSSGSGGSGSSYDRVGTDVFEVWTYTSGWDKFVKTDTHWWYKGEMAGKVCLFKTSSTSNFMVASRNYDRTCEGYSVSYYDYKVTEQTITSGTHYYYFN